MVGSAEAMASGSSPRPGGAGLGSVRGTRERRAPLRARVLRRHPAAGRPAGGEQRHLPRQTGLVGHEDSWSPTGRRAERERRDPGGKPAAVVTDDVPFDARANGASVASGAPWARPGAARGSMGSAEQPSDDGRQDPDRLSSCRVSGASRRARRTRAMTRDAREAARTVVRRRRTAVRRRAGLLAVGASATLPPCRPVASLSSSPAPPECCCPVAPCRF